MEEQSVQVLQDQHTPPKKNGSSFSRWAKIILVMLFLWWFNNYTLKITKVTITSEKVKNDIHIAVISDFHSHDGAFSIKNETVIKKVKKIDPDIVCVLGDMHSMDATEKEKDISLELMKGIIKEGYKLFFVLGEHDDRTNSYISKMRSNGINVLDDVSQKLTVKNTRITLYGISNAFFSQSFDLRNQFDIKKDEFNILMAHIPMYNDYEKFGADLTLCGDTHGGIIQIPFVGPVYYDNKFLPELSMDKNKIYDKGLFEYDGGHMFITSGIGNNVKTYNLPVRFFNRPEIASITITPE